MINAMLMNAKLPLNLWGEALLTACHVYNKIPLKRLGGSPYELWNNGRKPNLNYFKVWGCIAYYKVFDPHRRKLGPRGIKSIFVGYAQNSKAYRLLDLESNVIVETIHVEFFESKFLHNSLEPNRNQQIQALPNEGDARVSGKRNQESESSEPRRSTRQRKEKLLDSDFVSPDSIIFLLRQLEKKSRM